MRNFKWFVRETKARLVSPNGRRYMKWRLIEGVIICLFIWNVMPDYETFRWLFGLESLTPYVWAISALPLSIVWMILDVWFSEQKIPNKEEEQ